MGHLFVRPLTKPWEGGFAALYEYIIASIPIKLVNNMPSSYDYDFDPLHMGLLRAWADHDPLSLLVYVSRVPNFAEFANPMYREWWNIATLFLPARMRTTIVMYLVLRYHAHVPGILWQHWHGFPPLGNNTHMFMDYWNASWLLWGEDMRWRVQQLYSMYNPNEELDVFEDEDDEIQAEIVAAVCPTLGRYASLLLLPAPGPHPHRTRPFDLTTTDARTRCRGRAERPRLSGTRKRGVWPSTGSRTWCAAATRTASTRSL